MGITYNSRNIEVQVYLQPTAHPCEFRILTSFRPMFSLHTPCQHWKTRGFLMFSEVYKKDNWPEMG